MSDTFPKPIIDDVFPGDTDWIPETLTPDQEMAVKLAWVKLDDLFDSIEGGPHLKDRSLTGWDAAKTALLLPYVIGYINYGQPPLDFNLDTFPWDENGILVSQGLVVEIIKHLIRSYTEQPTPQGSGYARLSRKDYAQAWMPILEQEKEMFEMMLKFFRRSYLQLGSGAGLLTYKNFGAARGRRGIFRARGIRWY